MSVVSEIERIKTNISNAYTELEGKGATIPTEKNSANLPNTIASIQSGGGEAIEITDARYLFYNGVRIDAADALINAISPNCEIFSQMFMTYNGTEIPMFNCSNGKNFVQTFANCSNITTIPQIDTSNCENFSSAFQNCSSLNTLPPLNLSKCTTLESTFSGCSKLTSIPAIDTSKVQNFERAFYQCSKLSTIDLDLSSATEADNMFYSCYALTSAILRNSNLVTSFGNLFANCEKLTTVQLNTDSATYLNSLFSACGALTDIPLLNCENVTNIRSAFWVCSKLTNLGGFKDLGKAYLTTSAANYNNYMLDISSSSLITHDSMMNIINNVYDIATKGCNPQKIKVNSTVLGRLSEEEIAIATNKGWTVATS